MRSFRGTFFRKSSAFAFRVGPLVIAALLTTPSAYSDQQTKASLIDELIELSNARVSYDTTIKAMTDQLRPMFKANRDIIDRQLHPTQLPAGGQPAPRVELDALLDHYQTQLDELMRKTLAWETVRTRIVALYDQVFSEDELAGIVAFYKTSIGQSFAAKMPDVATHVAQIGKETTQSLRPEVTRLVKETLDKAKQLGYTMTPAPPPAGAGVGVIPGRNEGGVIGGIIGSVPTAAPPPQPPGDPNAPHPQRIRIGGNVQAAKLVRQPKPVYPPLAKQARITGVVILNAVIAKDGTVASLTLAEGHPLLVPAAMDAVKQWVYEPTLVNGVAAEVVTQIEVNFTLSVNDSER